MPFLGCIADDFTGATDLANNLVRSGLRTVQTIGVPSSPLLEGADAVVVALKSRTVPAQEAVELSRQALHWLKAQGAQQIYFKYCSTFDSTAQGNIGPVTDMLLDELYGPGRGFAVVCPSFPEAQRTVYKGHLFVGDALLSDSGMRHHPLTPMLDSNVVRLMQAQSRRQVALIPVDVVAKGRDAIRQRMQELALAGVSIAVVDAITNEDLAKIGAATAKHLLVTAASGLALGLGPHWRPREDVLSATALAAPSPGYRAVISGSCSLASNAQVLSFLSRGVPAMAVDPMEIAAGHKVVAKVLDWAVPRLASGAVLVYATAGAEAVEQVQAQLGAAKAGQLVEKVLSEIAVGLVKAGVRQLVIAGGETSGAVVQALAIEQLVIGPQIDPGVPWTQAQSPLCQGECLRLALKSGNFGSPDFFQKAFNMLDNNEH